MDKNLAWYKDKKIENLSKVLVNKEYLVHKVDTLEEAKATILSLLDKERTVALGDTWKLNDEKFVEELRKYNFFDFFKYSGRERDEFRRKTILADVAILEGEFVTEDGQIIMVGDYNTSSALFGAKSIIVLLSEEKIVKNLARGLAKVDELEKYYKLRSEAVEHFTEDQLSVGIIENGRKFEKRITLVITR